MSLKERILNRIKSTNDPEVLHEPDKWISSMVGVTAAEKFSKDEIAAAQEGYEQFLAGDIVSREKANHLFNEWLKEK